MRPASAAGALLLACVALTGRAGDVERGRLLYELHCGGCHYERVHQRMKTKIKDLDDLRDEVSRWAAQTNRTFSAEEIDQVVQYLNASHYRIGLPPDMLPQRRR